MRVLHVINSLQVGGAEVLVTNLAISAREYGVASDVYVLKRCGTRLERALAVEQVALFDGGALPIRSPLHIRLLAHHCRKRAYDVVHAHLFPAQLWAACVAAILGERGPVWVTTEHNTFNRRRRPLFRPLDRWMYAKYDSVACITEAVRNSLTEWVPPAEKSARVVLNGIDVAAVTSATPCERRDLGIPEGQLIVSVGRLVPQKGYDVLLQAIAQLEAVQLALVGDGILRRELENQARALGIEKRVHFLGVREDVHRILKAADVYVQPSRWEGFGIAAVEAMAAGLPVVAADVRGLGDVVRSAGLLVPSEDVEALTEALRAITRDTVFRGTVANRCAQRALEYDICRTTHEYLRLYREAQGAARSSGQSLA